MSYYYKYNFVSPVPSYALIKEELKSYFDTGAVDDSLFSLYTERCLQKLGRGGYKINESILSIEDFKSTLPVDFIAVREAWLCTNYDTSYQLPGANYEQITNTSTRIDSADVYCDPCAECANPAIIRAIYKTTKQVAFTVTRSFLLQPGNITVKDNCSYDCANIGVTAPESFDIRDNKFVVTFRTGNVYLTYYSEERTDEGYQLIPDNVRIKEYIEGYIKYKIFEQLCNQVTDETYNQIEAKRQRYEIELAEKQVLAEVEMRKQTPYQKRQQALRTLRRHDKYNIQ